MSIAAETPQPTSQSATPKLVASRRHTVGLLLILLVLAVAGAYFQSRSSPGPGLAPQHKGIVPLYLGLIGMEWLLLWYVWGVGLRHTGMRLRDLIGGRWNSATSLLLDFVIAIPFWFVWEATARGMHRLLGPAQAKTVNILLPRGWLEIVLWVGLSLSAGFCEEVVYRGYLQKQFHALTGSLSLAVLLQAVVFGLGHSYQGLKLVILIMVLGALFGVLAAACKSLRPGMLSHAWSDIYGGIFFR